MIEVGIALKEQVIALESMIEEKQATISASLDSERVFAHGDLLKFLLTHSQEFLYVV